jgi:hypothetical protein
VSTSCRSRVAYCYDAISVACEIQYISSKTLLTVVVVVVVVAGEGAALRLQALAHCDGVHVVVGVVPRAED